jgi:hypothetical protein
MNFNIIEDIFLSKLGVQLYYETFYSPPDTRTGENLKGFIIKEYDTTQNISCPPNLILNAQVGVVAGSNNVTDLHNFIVELIGLTYNDFEVVKITEFVHKSLPALQIEIKVKL